MVKEQDPKARIKELDKLEKKIQKEKVEVEREIKQKIIEEIEDTVLREKKPKKEQLKRTEKDSIEELVADAPLTKENETTGVSYDPVTDKIETGMYEQQKEQDSLYSRGSPSSLYGNKESSIGYSSQEEDHDKALGKKKNWYEA